MNHSNQEINKKAEFGWVMFDWANSSYSLVISTAIFPIFFIANTDAIINILGFQVTNSSIYAFSVSFAYILICLLSPVLSGIADYGGRRKFFMIIFTTIGSIACSSLYFFQGMSTLVLGLTAFIIASASHAGSLVFYDAYLSELVPPKRSDKLSAKGYAYGYVGSVILLIFNIVIIQKPELIGLENAKEASRIAFLSVGLWWFLFAQFSFRYLPKDIPKYNESFSLSHGIIELKKAWEIIKINQDIKNYLMAFFFYSAGVQTVIYLASPFAQKELGFESQELIIIILLLQIVAIIGAYTFSALSKHKNNLFGIKIMLLIWIVICIMAYLVTEKWFFYVIAALVGMVLGGIQAISRSTYSKLIPANHSDNTCFFSFYDVIYYLSIVTGTFAFGLVDQITGSMRYSVLVLAIFFVIGLFYIRTVRTSAIRV
ncbi:MAG: MFS transporter [Saprospiraceae bacterium]|jgi:UMF1 family MFS transporter|nr:MFS transporter [Saprospiraceae bacterium]